MYGSVPCVPISPQVLSRQQGVSIEEGPGIMMKTLKFMRRKMGGIQLEGDNSIEKQDNHKRGTGVTEGVRKCDIGNHLRMMEILGNLIGQTAGLTKENPIILFYLYFLLLCFV